ncbi:hypothetical protein B0J12DRAFT_342980 [Macrophomina phaseolina]|uniref:Rhodopsin domain-containing protein n=1 Tax=Macrophomina phaseolina TaxID=35725 RepID=A0ABQ8GQ79_9PEZI|nr:hypothetical protein B0J12DRAFT_342980 [Macrophomina phaseolina]
MSLPAGTDLSQVPAMQPPEGVQSNLIDPPSYHHRLLVLNIVFTSCMVALVAVRLVVKGLISKVLWWDDLACVVAAMGSITHAVVMMIQTRIGYGRHMWDIPVTWLLKKSNLGLLNADNPVYLTTIYMAKVSMLLLYLRIFPRNTNMGRWIIYMLVFLTAFWLSMLGPAIAAQYKCVSLSAPSTDFCTAISNSLIILNAAVTVATDFYVLLLPIPPFFKLLFKTRQKLLICIIFLTGLVACAASTTRLGLFLNSFGSADILWEQANNSMYTIVELNAGIISGCLLNLPAFCGYSKGAALRAYHSVKSLVSVDSSRGSTRASSFERGTGVEEVVQVEHKDNDSDVHSGTVTRFRECDV